MGHSSYHHHHLLILSYPYFKKTPYPDPPCRLPPLLPFPPPSTNIMVLPQYGDEPPYPTPHDAKRLSLYSPTYSSRPNAAELTLEHAPVVLSLHPLADTETDELVEDTQLKHTSRSWTYQTKRMSINLGENKWGLVQRPTYGRGAIIEGVVSCRAGTTCKKLTVTVRGCLPS